MARRKKPEVKCYHCDRDLQYELEAMRESVARTIGQYHSMERSNIKLEGELDRVRNLVEDAFYEGYHWPDEGKAEWEDSDSFRKLGKVQMIEAPDDRYDLKPEDEE